MTKVLKLLMPVFFLASYAVAAYVIYYGVNDVFSIQNSFQVVIGNLIFIFLLLLYAHFVCNVQWSELLTTKLNLKKGLVILAMIPGIQFLTGRVILILMKYFHYTYSLEIRELGELKLFIFDALFALILAPIMEELLFRFCVISSYRTFVGKMYGMIIGAILFGYMHATMSVRMRAIVMGIILGVIFLMTNDLLVCILIHSGSNLVVTICACLSLYIQDEEVMSVASSEIYVNNPILVVSVLISLLGAAVLFKRC